MPYITYQVEKLSEIKDEVYPLLIKHWEEIALNKDKVPLDPNWELYAKFEAMELLNITTARRNGEIVGYFAYIICPNLHYKSLVIADGDIFYIDKDYRRSGIAIKLLAESEKNVRAAGANKIVNKTKIHFANANGIAASKLFERAGYTKIEEHFAKLLD